MIKHVLKELIMTENDFSKWHKWDIHMHTPGTKRHNDYGGGLNNEKIRDTFIKHIKESNLDAIGVTDYYDIENYKSLLSIQSQDSELQNILLVPNIEIRLRETTRGKSNECINLHIIFDPEKLTPNNIQKHFIDKLFTVYKSSRYTLSMDKQLSEDSNVSLDKVLDRFLIKFDDLIDILESNSLLKGNYLIAVPNEDISGELQNNLGKGDFIYDNLVEKVDIVLSHSSKDYNHWVNSESSEGNIKPVLSGSDAHSFKNHSDIQTHYGIGEEYTWIKSTLNFTGLRQIKYEPNRRVKLAAVSKNNPADLNLKYINTLRVIPQNSSISINNSIIPFSPNLTTIIGPRSSGKSALLSLIAHKDYKDDPDKIVKNTISNYLGIIDSVNIELKDSQNESLNFPISYYPQNFINSLSETSETLQKVIKEKIFKNSSAQNIFEQSEAAALALTQKNSRIIEEMKNLSSSIYQKEEYIKSFASLSNLSLQKEELEQKKSILVETLSLSEDEKIKLKDAQKTATHLKGQQYEVSENINNIEKFKDLFQNNSNSFKNMFSTMNEKTFLKNNEKLNQLNNEFKVWSTKGIDILQDILDTSNSLKVKTSFKLQSNMSILEAYDKKNTNIQTEMETISGNIFKIDTDIRTVNALQKNIKSLKERYQTLETSLCDLVVEIKNNRNDININFSKMSIFGTVDKKSTKLSLKSKIIIDTDNNFNHRKINKIVEQFDVEEKYNSQYQKILDIITNSDNKLFNWEDSDYKKLIDFIPKFLEIDESYFVQGNSALDVMLAVFNKLSEMQYQLLLGNDSLDTMSPGMRGIVLLQVMLNNTDSNSIILLDQPEDDLDNETIVNTLVPLIQRISLTRQIILVTHNANLVVLTDSDEVIVAERKQADFNVTYLFGALEDSIIRKKVTDIMEGGMDAFTTREIRYQLK